MNCYLGRFKEAGGREGDKEHAIPYHRYSECRKLPSLGPGE